MPLCLLSHWRSRDLYLTSGQLKISKMHTGTHYIASLTDKLLILVCSQFCRPSSQLKGRDAAQLKFVHLSEKEVEDILWRRFKKTCRNVPVHDNFYLSWFLRGPRGYNPLTRPDFASPYLTREGFRRVKVSEISL